MYSEINKQGSHDFGRSGSDPILYYELVLASREAAVVEANRVREEETANNDENTSQSPDQSVRTSDMTESE